MVGKKSVRLEISEGRKDEWQQVASDEDRSLSDLIRRAMAQYIASGDTATGNVGGIPESVENEITTVAKNTEGIQAELSSLADRFDRIENELYDRSEVRTVAYQVYEVLPTYPLQGYVRLDDGSEALEGSVEWIADQLDEPTDMIEQAAEELVVTSMHVRLADDRTTEETGIRRYYKEER
jgi:hypothetical protein